MKLKTFLPLLLLVAAFGFADAQQKKKTAVAPATAAPSGKPNIVIIWGDDIGQTNISAFTFRFKIN